jgi:membrane associated rhomboid family serine protease
MAPDSVVPIVGASGSVAAVLGAYIVWYPRATVTAGIPLLFVLLPLRVPAFVMIGMWFLQNVIAGAQTLGQTADPGGGVAWFAHIGGFAFGTLVAVSAAALWAARGGRRGDRGKSAL